VPGISVPRVPVEGRHAWHLFVVIVDPAAGVTRDELAASLASDGIGTSVHFIPVHRLSYFRELLDACPLPGADLAGERVLSLPMHPSLSDSDVDRVCDSVRGAMTERASRAVGRSKR
jgi:perosamine synthetase